MGRLLLIVGLSAAAGVAAGVAVAAWGVMSMVSEDSVAEF